MTDTYNILKEKLKDFKRRYYTILLVRGILYFIGISLFWLMAVSVIAYFNYLTVSIKTFLFFFSLTLYLLTFIFYILIPILKLAGISKVISDKEASKIISRHFPDIKDKLLNTIELSELSSNNSFSKQLLEASIESRTNELKPIPFVKAIDYSMVKRATYLLIPVIILFIILLTYNKEVIKTGSKRILQYSTYTSPPSPFSFKVLNDSLSVIKGKDITIKIKVEGSKLPQQVEIVYGGNTFYMKQDTINIFSYTFKNINRSLSFYLKSGKYRTSNYFINVIPAPILLNIITSFYPPAYTGIKSQIQEGTGDITVPEGSKIKWQLTLAETDSVKIILDTKKRIYLTKHNNKFTGETIIHKSQDYAVVVTNKYIHNKTTASYHINVIPDQYPQIIVKQYVDSLNPAVYYFTGTIKDDYGFSKLTFNYQESKDHTDTIALPIANNLNLQAFEFSFDFSKIKTDLSTITYYFEVWDNDQVNGSKSTKSILYSFQVPDKEKLDSIDAATQKELAEKIFKSQNLISDIKNQMDRLRQDRIQQNLSKWEKTKILNDIKNKQQELERNVAEMNKMLKQSNNLQNAFSQQKEDLIKKQKEIEKLMENLMDDEMKKLLDELAKLLQNNKDKKFEQKSKEAEINLDEMSKQLDRNLEILKRWEVEKNVEKISDELNQLAKKQEQVAEKIKKSPKNDEQKQKNIEEQQKIENEFEKLMNKYEETKKKNQELEHPYKLDNFSEQKNNIKQGLQNAKQQLQQGKNRKASKQQKQNAKQMQQMAQQMQMMMQNQQMQQMAEDITTLQQLAENINIFSIQQESLMKQFRKIHYRSDNIEHLIQQQHELKTAFGTISDSLYALSKRLPMVATTITQELGNVKIKLEKTENALKDGKYYQASTLQQFVMTSANNLDLLIAELIDAMKNQMQNQSQSQSSCHKPGKKAGQTISQMQKSMESLKQQLQRMIDELKKQKGSKNNGKQMAKQMAKSIAEYEKFKDQLAKLMNSEDLHPETMQKLNDINRLLEKNLNDIINNNLNDNLLKRQDKILVRLLEAENAERQRKTDNQRKAETAKDYIYRNKINLKSYNKEKQQFNDILYHQNLKLNKVYEKKYKQYILNLEM